MGEFFNGWRRKVGCITLVIACVFAAGWVRSYWEMDTLGFGIHQRQHWLASRNGNLLWLSPIEDQGVSWGFGSPLDKVNVKYLLQYNEDKIYLPGLMIKLWTIAYWPLVIPLTLLSAYLLLIKPRPKKPAVINLTTP